MEVPIRDTDGNTIGTAVVDLVNGTITGTITDPDMAATLGALRNLSVELGPKPCVTIACPPMEEIELNYISPPHFHVWAPGEPQSIFTAEAIYPVRPIRYVPPWERRPGSRRGG